MIIFDLDFHGLSLDGYESTLDLLANIPVSWELFEMCWATGNPIAVTDFLGKSIHDQEYPLSKLNQVSIYNETYISGGYVETSEVRQRNLNNSRGIINVLPGQLDYCSKILELARSLHITVIEVIQPSSIDSLWSILNYTDVVNSLRKAAGLYKVPFIDFNDIMHLDSRLDYIDMYHLNKRGVLKFNKKLIEKLLAMKA